MELDCADDKLWSNDMKKEADYCIFTAANLGLVNIVQRILQSGKCDVNAKNQAGWTPLMYAAFNGRINILELLLSCGAKCNLQNKIGRNALMISSSCGQVEVVKRLLEANCLIELRDSHDWPALFHATQNDNNDVIELLISKGADVNYQERNFGYSALMIAAIEGNISTVNLLLQYRANANLRSTSGDTAQSLALLHQQINIAKLIAESLCAVRNGPATKVEDLSSILKIHGLEKYYPIFEDQEIDLALFLTLNEEDLIEIGIKNLGPRKKIIYLIQLLLTNMSL